MKKMTQFIKEIFNKILDILFPLSPIEEEIREATAETILQNCKRASIRNIKNKNTIVIFDYKDRLIRQMILSLKFRSNKKLAKVFAKAIHNEIIEDFSDINIFSNFDDPILIPIPISKNRFRERGFNQTEILSEEIIKLSGDDFFKLEKDVLIKIKDTPNQSSIKNRKERLENLKDCFSVKNPEKIKGRNIILIDDVITTGATINEAKKVLKHAGVKKIITIAVAH